MWDEGLVKRLLLYTAQKCGVRMWKELNKRLCWLRQFPGLVSLPKALIKYQKNTSKYIPTKLINSYFEQLISKLYI
jgi:hypothetical protein